MKISDTNGSNIAVRGLLNILSDLLEDAQSQNVEKASHARILALEILSKYLFFLSIVSSGWKSWSDSIFQKKVLYVDVLVNMPISEVLFIMAWVPWQSNILSLHKTLPSPLLFR